MRLRVVLAMAVFALSARADLFDISITGTDIHGNPATGSGTLTTDGACIICTPGSGLITFDAVFPGGDYHFPLKSPFAQFGLLEFDRPADALDILVGDDGAADLLTANLNGTWKIVTNVGIPIGGTYSITAVPEPMSLILLLTMTALIFGGKAFSIVRRSP